MYRKTKKVKPIHQNLPMKKLIDFVFLINASKHTLMNSLINSSKQNLCFDIWTIVSTYLEFQDKIALRSVCVNARKHNHILEIPYSLERKLTDDIIERIPALTQLRKLSASYNPNISKSTNNIINELMNSLIYELE